MQRVYCPNDECRYTGCHSVSFTILTVVLRIIILSVNMLSVIMQSILLSTMINVVAPVNHLRQSVSVFDVDEAVVDPQHGQGVSRLGRAVSGSGG